MVHMNKATRKVVSVILAVLLIFGNTALIQTANAATLNPGEVYVDKHRSTYELSPGESTDISLLVQTVGTTITRKIDVVITIDISNSMVNNSDGSSTVMALTQTAAKSLASQILAANSASRIALVRYGDFASVYNFSSGSWIKLDDATTSSTLSGNELYTSNLSAINTRRQYSQQSERWLCLGRPGRRRLELADRPRRYNNRSRPCPDPACRR